MVVEFTNSSNMTYIWHRRGCDVPGESKARRVTSVVDALPLRLCFHREACQHQGQTSARYISASMAQHSNFDRRRINGPESSSHPIFEDEEKATPTQKPVRTSRKNDEIRPICE